MWQDEGEADRDWDRGRDRNRVQKMPMQRDRDNDDDNDDEIMRIRQEHEELARRQTAQLELLRDSVDELRGANQVLRDQKRQALEQLEKEREARRRDREETDWDRDRGGDGGSASGGGVAEDRETLALSLSSARAEIQRLNELLSEARSQFSDVNTHLGVLTDRMHSLSRERDALAAAGVAQQADLVSVRQQHTQLQQRQQHQEQREKARRDQDKSAMMLLAREIEQWDHKVPNSASRQ